MIEIDELITKIASLRQKIPRRSRGLMTRKRRRLVTSLQSGVTRVVLHHGRRVGDDPMKKGAKYEWSAGKFNTSYRDISVIIAENKKCRNINSILR